MKNQILVFDDNTKNLRSLREILTREGYNIITATDKESAFELMKHISFDYVIARSSILGVAENDNSNNKRNS